MLMQGTAALPITLTLRDAPLRPGTSELIGVITLAPVAVGIFCWALWSVPDGTTSDTLVTSGAYSRLRHPIYLAFLAMLLATGFVASAGLALVAATGLYVAGTELRIASEEADLEERFPADYRKYRLKTRWRYLPGLR
jgi:protein-S-isoprenylcysteine O-methyltransferase Ste14